MKERTETRDIITRIPAVVVIAAGVERSQSLCSWALLAGVSLAEA